MGFSRYLLPAGLLIIMTGCGGEGSNALSPQEFSDSAGAGVLMLEWRMPDHRENGVYLEDSEIGGYELRFRAAGERQYQRLVIEDGLATSYSLPMQDLTDYVVEIAAFDSDGLFSRYVPLTPVEVVQ
ncbi:fibronectin type III domain-containing protein [Marinimicrobium alkaliphilum]|uniref:fibronectin type III domain-containing protein n=1 Tax=Marinimicrobium alkaliphilum TaxID=2202654 RepID=UPI000DBAB628|nr:fibronectin type III domain-containing protein [Marinimicrobium alkaliphilum]